ncbi:DPP IV N-terminal domain-containing protein [Patescibacteria group bacterium]|nr:DPP IV N-terminal domain-containing protein [Patescibacteria group bacterium]
MREILQNKFFSWKCKVALTFFIFFFLTFTFSQDLPSTNSSTNTNSQQEPINKQEKQNLILFSPSGKIHTPTPLFFWSKLNDTQTFTLTIYNFQKQKLIEVSGIQVSNFVFNEQFKKGKYYWQVKDNNGLISKLTAFNITNKKKQEEGSKKQDEGTEAQSSKGTKSEQLQNENCKSQNANCEGEKQETQQGTKAQSSTGTEGKTSLDPLNPVPLESSLKLQSVYIENTFNLQKLTNFNFDVSNPIFTPEGQKIIFSGEKENNSTIYLLYLKTNLLKQLTTSGEAIKDSYPQLTKDYKLIFCSNRTQKNNLWLISLTKPQGYTLLNTPTAVYNSACAPSVSPDSKLIAYTNESHIWITTLYSPTATQLTTGKDPSFSPDGKKIIFTSNITGNYDIYQIDVTSQNLTQLTQDLTDETNPKYSPDNTRIVYEKNKDLWLLNLKTFAQTQLTNNPAEDKDPVFSPKGDSIIFVSNRDGNFNIYKITLEKKTVIKKGTETQSLEK